ncbi:hypothetical protein L1887_34666 [Cichorium endivia]|nr:hypothetical protein L1887_34666 [Cichorium endivia]
MKVVGEGMNLIGPATLCGNSEIQGGDGDGDSDSPPSPSSCTFFHIVGDLIAVVVALDLYWDLCKHEHGVLILEYVLTSNE